MPFCQQSLSLQRLQNINSGLSTGTGTAGAQAVNFVSKLLQNKSVSMDVAVKNIGSYNPLKSLESLVLKTAATLQQIPTGIKMEMKFKDHHIRHI